MPKTIYELYPNFYNNPLIHSIGLTPKWSISDENKRPIDLVTFAMTDRIVGGDTSSICRYCRRLSIQPCIFLRSSNRWLHDS